MMPLIVIQAICPVLSFSSGVSNIQIWIWLVAIASIVIILELILLRSFVVNRVDVEAMKDAWKYFRKAQK
jgi:uncharacterized membrane protein YedE/YeeE